MAAPEAGPRGTRIALVDDDALFRATLNQNLVDEGFETVDFASGAELLDHFAAGGAAAVVLLDWRMPEMSGLDTLRGMRDRGLGVPVIFLTALSDQIYEEAALERGAVDFVEKSRSFSILLRRIRLITDGMKGAGAERRVAADAKVLRVGQLELDFESRRALWRREQVNLTLTEFHLVAELATNAGKDVAYRKLYDQVHGEGFSSGYGAEGYRTNVRTFVKRIREKFREIDDSFSRIQNYPGFGYRWLDDNGEH